MGDLVAFLGVSLLVIATPGPDTALVIRNALLGGRGGGTATALGVAAGQAVWTVAAATGVTALLVASEPAFQAVKIAGAAYLVFLGATALHGALRGRPHGGDVSGPARTLAAGSAFRQGLVSDLGNPKMAVFFTSLLPQFASPDDPSLVSLLALGLLFCLLTLCWLSGYALVVAKAGDALLKPLARRIVQGVSGAVLLALGLRLAGESR